ncbi:Spo0B domain-containing protein [Planococcus sp. YIM B11945]|uniref:Spo0B domain-containing protein n=1 Tax=Planococcus sp. YIM B11945 TaxID=3435410 RepID=UPI003D7F06F9
MENTLTMAQSLRHARHDFLNELQLINMNLDLGRIEQAQAIIRSHAEAAVQLSRLSALKLPKTEEWLLVSKWRFPELHFELACDARKAPVQRDAEMAEALEAVVQLLIKQMDPWEKHQSQLMVSADSSWFKIELEVDGKWPDMELPVFSQLHVGKECKSGRTIFSVRAQMEG